MFIHPAVHLEITRLRQQDRLAKAERHRNAAAVLAGRQEDRGQWLPEPPTLHQSTQQTTARHLQQANP
jgi:hypothetical protein